MRNVEPRKPSVGNQPSSKLIAPSKYVVASIVASISYHSNGSPRTGLRRLLWKDQRPTRKSKSSVTFGSSIGGGGVSRRVKSMIQLVSQVSPPSLEYACSQ